MLDRIRYFQAVVQHRSFTKAADQCHISQSAISQQIQSLENELGVKLLNREKRNLSLTEAGEHFYRKSLVLISDYEQIVRETRKIDKDEEAELRIGVLLTYGGEELQLAVSEFVAKYPSVDIRLHTANHEELFRMLRDEQLDMNLLDQRRSFSAEYENIILKKQYCRIEIARDNPLSQMDYVTEEDLRNIPCILVAEQSREEEERKYYEEIYGFTGDFLYAPTIKDARLMVVSKRGFMPVDGEPVLSHFNTTIARIPFYKGKEQFTRNMCLFYKKDNSGYYIEEFTEMLTRQFQDQRE